MRRSWDLRVRLDDLSGLRRVTGPGPAQTLGSMANEGNCLPSFAASAWVSACPHRPSRPSRPPPAWRRRRSRAPSRTRHGSARKPDATSSGSPGSSATFRARGCARGRSRFSSPTSPIPSISTSSAAPSGQLRAADYTQVLIDTEESGELEADLIERCGGSIDGVILAASRLSDSAIGELAKTLPLVVINRHVPGVPTVVLDTAAGGRHALDHLLSLGHRDIVYVAGPERSWANAVRWRALTEAAERHGITVGRVGRSPRCGRREARAADAVLHSGATASIVFNDLLAIGMLTRFADRGVPVPERLSVVGCDDIFGADFCSPGPDDHHHAHRAGRPGRRDAAPRLHRVATRRWSRRRAAADPPDGARLDRAAVGDRPRGPATGNTAAGNTVIDDDRLFPADPGTREIARRLYARVRSAPILSPHGHVDARILASNDPFPDPAALLVTPDHYVTRCCTRAASRSTGCVRPRRPARSGPSCARAGTSSRERPCDSGSRASSASCSGST